MGKSYPIDASDYEALLRKHVLRPQEWAGSAGTDFWMVTAANGNLTSSVTPLISTYGWTATSLTLQDGSAADFMTSADVGSPGSWVQNAQSDLLKSPAIFGDYAHAHQAMLLLNKKTLPRYLIGDFYAWFSVASANDTTGALGFVEDNGSIVVAADALATFVSDGTNFILRSGAATGTGAVAIDTNPHRFRIVFDRVAALAYGYVDGVAAGSIAIENDEWPAAVGAGSGGVTNLVQLAQAHIFYAYRVPQEV